MEDAERQLGPVIRRAALGYTPKRLDIPLVYFSASESDNAVTVNPWVEVQDDLGLDVVSLDGVHFLPEDRCIIGEGRVGELTEHLLQRLPSSSPS